MGIGERIKAARSASMLSQQALADGAGVSKMAISKYERGLNIPGSSVLIRLAKVLGVKVEYFLRPITVTLSAATYRCRPSLSEKQKGAVIARMQEWLERYLEVDSLFGETPPFALPDDLDGRVNTLDDVERVAQDLRKAWDLGQDAIESLVEVLEDKGVKVGLIDGDKDFDALTCWVNERVPAIAVKDGLVGDRQRFSLAHELAHLVLEPAEGVNGEKAAYRFAGAFLVPGPVAVFELGQWRRRLSLPELYLLKHKYGLSIQAWIHRAEELDIVSSQHADKLLDRFKWSGWNIEEPGDQVPMEKPSRMERMVMHALAEDMISESRAAELLGVSLNDFREEVGQYVGFLAGVRG